MRRPQFRPPRQGEELAGQLVSAAAAVVHSDAASPTPESRAPVVTPWTRRISWARIGTLALLVAIVIVALSLRFVGLGWGRPFVYHPDEWVVANPAMDMVRTGSWNPDLFLYPSGLIYVERFIIAVLHQIDPTVSLATTAPGGYAGLPWRGGSTALPEQFPYFYVGRAFVAMVGALMALPTYFAARSVSNAVGGIAAAVAIAVAPFAVTNSHYLTTDVPTAAMVVLTLCLSLRGLTGGRRWLLAAGFAAGLAASTKYNGGLVVIVPLAVLLTSCPPRQLLRRPTLTTAGLIVLASVAGFVLLTPAVVFDASHVWTGGILLQFQVYSGGLLGAEGTDNAIYFLRVLWGGNGLGPGLSILAAFGLLISVVQHRRADVAVLSFVLAYYVLLSLPPVRFDQDLLPLMPFLAVLAGRTVGWLVDFLTAPATADCPPATDPLGHRRARGGRRGRRGGHALGLCGDRARPGVPCTRHSHDRLGLDRAEHPARSHHRSRGIHATDPELRIQRWVRVASCGQAVGVVPLRRLRLRGHEQLPVRQVQGARASGCVLPFAAGRAHRP